MTETFATEVSDSIEPIVEHPLLSLMESLSAFWEKPVDRKMPRHTSDTTSLHRFHVRNTNTKLDPPPFCKCASAIYAFSTRTGT